MVRKKNVLILTLLIFFLFNGCAYNLANNITIVNSENKNPNKDLTIGKKVEGNAYYPYLIGYNLQDSIDEAFENAGSEYNMLVNATVNVKFYYLLIYFSKYVIIKGTAINSNELKTSMGEAKYHKWLVNQNVLYHSKAEKH